jgi:hypothetical protein
MRRARLIWLAPCLCLAGCKVADARVYNLRTLHEEDGRHVRVAVLYDDLEYVMRNGLLGLVPGLEAKRREKEAKPIKDPLATCLSNAIELSDIGSASSAPARIETFTMLAGKCPWKLSRELAITQLGRAGERLELASAPAPPAPAEGTAAPGPAQVAEALAQLVRAVTPSQDLQARPSLEQACSALAALPLDANGAQRALRASALLARRFGESDPAAAPLRALVTDMERRCVRFGLAAGLADTDPLVRAAAVAADVRANGHARLGLHLDRLDPGSADAERADVVMLRVLRLIRKLGPPPAEAGLTEELAAAERERRLGTVYDIATRHPEGRVRVAAMLALERWTEGAVDSLREEDWQAWFVARSQAQP